MDICPKTPTYHRGLSGVLSVQEKPHKIWGKKEKQNPPRCVKYFQQRCKFGKSKVILVCVSVCVLTGSLLSMGGVRG